MDSAWRSAFDRSLLHTEATLLQLQGHRASYDRAKQKVDDYLGPVPNSTALSASTPRPETGDEDVGVPPPLPQHRYREFQRSAMLRHPSPTVTNSLPGVESTPVHRHDRETSSYVASSFIDAPTPLQLLNSQMRNAALDLELEKTKRVDSIRDLTHRTAAQLTEVKARLVQLEDENALLRRSVRALETRFAFRDGGSSVSEGLCSPAPASPPRPLQTGPPSSIPSIKAALLQGTATTTSSILERLTAVEAAVARQQRLLEDRQSRLDVTVSGAVETRVAVEVERVRGVARDTAREAAEQLIQLRLSTLMSGLQSDVQRAAEAAASSEAIARVAENTSQEAERRLSAQLQRLTGQMSDLHTSLGAGGGGVGRSTIPQQIAALEQRTDDDFRQVRAELRQLRQDAETRVSEGDQLQRRVTSVAKSEAQAVLAELLAKQQSEEPAFQKADAVSLLNTAVVPLHDELQKIRESLMQQQQQVDEEQRKTGIRFATMTAAAGEWTLVEERCQQQVDAQNKSLSCIRADIVASTNQLREEASNTRSQLRDAMEESTAKLDERLSTMVRDRTSRIEAALLQKTHSIEEQKGELARLRASHDLTEERLQVIEATLAPLQVMLSRSMDEAKTRHDALQTMMQQTCATPLSRLSMEKDVLQHRIQQLEEGAADLQRIMLEQASEGRRGVDEQGRALRSTIEQRSAAHTETCEALRDQLTSLRRTVEQKMDVLANEAQQVLTESDVRRLLEEHQVATAVVKSTPPPLSPPSSASLANSTEGATTPAAAVRLPEIAEALQKRVEGVEMHLSSCTAALEELSLAQSQLKQEMAGQTTEEQLNTVQQELRAAHSDHQRLATDMENQLQSQKAQLAIQTEKATRASQELVEAAILQIKQEVSPPYFTRNIVADPSCLQHLAIHLQAHLHLPPEAEGRLAVVEGAVEQQKNFRRETQMHLGKIEAAVAAVGEVQPAADSVLSENHRNDIAELRMHCAALQEAHETLHEKYETTAVKKMAALSTTLEAVKNTADRAMAEVEQTQQQCAQLTAAQRQQLPSLKQYIHEIVEVIKSDQEAAVDPLRLRLRGVEERWRELVANHDAFQQQVELHHAASAKMQKELGDQLRSDMSAQVESVASVAEQKTASLRAGLDALSTTMQSQAEKAAVVVAAPIPAEAPSHPRIDELEERISQFETYNRESLVALSEALNCFQGDLQSVVVRFSEKVNTPGSGLQPPLTASSGISSPGAESTTTTGGPHQPGLINSLEDVLTYLLSQQRQLQRVLQQLHINTLQTLEILEQHEESTAAIPLIQDTINQVSEALVPLAQHLGVAIHLPQLPASELAALPTISSPGDRAEM